MDIIQGEKQHQIIKLTLDSAESIETTPEHPFYVKGKGWNPTSSLKVGQSLQLHNGTTVVVKEIDTSVQLGKVYNLTVANTHNYYVGQDGVLVHNCDLNKLHHIFDKAQHNLGGLLSDFGGDMSKAFSAIQQAANNMAKSKGISGVFEEVVQVGNHSVTVRGFASDGVTKIGTVFKP